MYDLNYEKMMKGRYEVRDAFSIQIILESEDIYISNIEVINYL
jgi:hypothetical protein